MSSEASSVITASGVIDWERLRTEFLEVNLAAQAKNKPAVSLRALAEKYKLNYGTVRNVASDQDWRVDLHRMAEDQRLRVDLTAVESEVEIRIRQAQYARVAQSKAIQRLQKVDPEDLTPRDAMELLKLGMEQERKALGMEGTYTPPAPVDIKSGQTREAVRLAMESIANLKRRLTVGESHVVPDPG